VPGDPVAVLGDNPAMTALTREPVAARAQRLRPSVAGQAARLLPPDGIGLHLGRLMRPAGTGPKLFASWEDTLVAFMAPRSGKTTVLAIPFTLSAPGAVIATSNKADLWAATAALRAGHGLPVWLFDPQQITR
jgi:type IV secretory pathway TraG/TraD family ATPase VirD4